MFLTGKNGLVFRHPFGHGLLPGFHAPLRSASLPGHIRAYGRRCFQIRLVGKPRRARKRAPRRGGKPPQLAYGLRERRAVLAIRRRRHVLERRVDGEGARRRRYRVGAMLGGLRCWICHRYSGNKPFHNRVKATINKVISSSEPGDLTQKQISNQFVGGLCIYI